MSIWLGCAITRYMKPNACEWLSLLQKLCLHLVCRKQHAMQLCLCKLIHTMYSLTFMDLLRATQCRKFMQWCYWKHKILCNTDCLLWTISKATSVCLECAGGPATPCKIAALSVPCLHGLHLGCKLPINFAGLQTMQNLKACSTLRLVPNNYNSKLSKRH